MKRQGFDFVLLIMKKLRDEICQTCILRKFSANSIIIFVSHSRNEALLSRLHRHKNASWPTHEINDDIIAATIIIEIIKLLKIKEFTNHSIKKMIKYIIATTATILTSIILIEDNYILEIEIEYNKSIFSKLRRSWINQINLKYS